MFDCLLTDHTTDETFEAPVTGPAHAIEFAFAQRRLSYAPDHTEALVERIAVSRVADGWRLEILALYEGTQQRYTLYIRHG